MQKLSGGKTPEIKKTGKEVKHPAFSRNSVIYHSITSTVLDKGREELPLRSGKGGALPFNRKEAGYYYSGYNPGSKRDSTSRQLDRYHLPRCVAEFGWRSKLLGVLEGI